VSKDVRIRGYFSKSKGVRELKFWETLVCMVSHSPKHATCSADISSYLTAPGISQRCSSLCNFQQFSVTSSVCTSDIFSAFNSQRAPPKNHGRAGGRHSYC